VISGWIVVREEKHIDDRFWVCQFREDAPRIAADVARYWRAEYGIDYHRKSDVDETCYGDQIFHYGVEDCFRVYVQPQPILEAGENCDASH